MAGYWEEDKKIRQYEELAGMKKTESQTEFGYRDMNRRYLMAHKEQLKLSKKGNISSKMAEHEARKKDLEAAWIKNTATRAEDIKKGGVGNDAKDVRFYANFDLKQMEVLLKNNDRGGNSDEYNSVVTDLELLNTLDTMVDEKEKITLLERIDESCSYYLRKKNPTFTSGKIRKAMIAHISTKVSAELALMRDERDQKSKEAKERLLGSAGEAYENYQSNKSDYDALRNALESYRNLMNGYLNEEFELTDKEKKSIDDHMAEILDKVGQQEVSPEQSDNLVTKYFNVLGWTDNKPKLVDNKELEDGGEELKNSPLKKRMYHTIKPIPGQEDASSLAKQLAGENKNGSRHFLSSGDIGKGTYFATSDETTGCDDAKASTESWLYGLKKGSVQVTVVLNGNAKIIGARQVNDAFKKLQREFPELAEKIRRGREIKDYGGNGFLTMVASMMGYNTIKGGEGRLGSRYWVVCDRKAMTISIDAYKRTDGGMVKIDLKDDGNNGSGDDKEK